MNRTASGKGRSFSFRNRKVQMSIPCLRAAWSVKTLKPTQKFVLIALSEKANEHNRCWPSVETIAGMTGISKRATYEALGFLKTAGLIEILSGGGKHRTNTYLLCLNGAPIAPLPSNGAPAALNGAPAALNGAPRAPHPSVTPKNPQGEAPRKFVSEYKAQIKVAEEEIEKLKSKGSDGDGVWHDPAMRQRYAELRRKIKTWNQEMMEI